MRERTVCYFKKSNEPVIDKCPVIDNAFRHNIVKVVCESTWLHSYQIIHREVETLWSSVAERLGRWTWNIKVEVPLWPLNWGCFSVHPIVQLRASFIVINSQLVWLLPVGSFKHVMSSCIICFIIRFHWPWIAPLEEWSIKIFIFKITNYF